MAAMFRGVVGRRARRRGASMLYVVAVMSVMVGFASLAVDFGRVQLAKSELRTAVDAAARYAVKGAPKQAAAYALARDAAADNTVNGQALTLQSSEVQVGAWNAATRTFSAGASPSTAVQISTSMVIPLSLGAAIGMPTCTIRASAVARQIPMGIVGLEGIRFTNNTFVGSYDSSSTRTPTASGAGRGASLSSNGAIEFAKNGQIRGDVILGQDSPGVIGNANISGTTTRLAVDVATPQAGTWNPTGGNPGGITQGHYIKTGTNPLPGGVYWFDALTITGTLSFSGPATVYVNGDIVFDGSSGIAIVAYNSVPSNLTIYQVGSGRSFTLKNNGEITACVIAPQSVFVAVNNVIFRGACVFQSIECKNNAEWYFDVQSGASLGGVIVR